MAPADAAETYVFILSARSGQLLHYGRELNAMDQAVTIMRSLRDPYRIAYLVHFERGPRRNTSGATG